MNNTEMTTGIKFLNPNDKQFQVLCWSAICMVSVHLIEKWHHFVSPKT